MAGKAAAKRRAKAAARKQAARSSGKRPAAVEEEEEPATPEPGAAGPPEGLRAGEKDVSAAAAESLKEMLGVVTLGAGGDRPEGVRDLSVPAQDTPGLDTLTGMGFHAGFAKIALEECGGSVERAVVWLLNHPDPEAEKPRQRAAANADALVSAQLAHLFEQTGVSWHDPRSCGYYYSPELQYWFNGATGMYWGGDPPAWSKAPPRRAVDILTDMGFGAEHAAMALRVCNGHVERAGNWLLGYADPEAEKETGQQWHEIRQWKVVNGRAVPAVDWVPRQRVVDPAATSARSAAGPSLEPWPTPGPTSSAPIGGVDHTKGSYIGALSCGARALHARKPDALQRPRPAPAMPVPRARASRRGVIKPSADDVEIQSSADVGEKDEAVRARTLKAAERMARTDASTAADVRPWGDDDSGADAAGDEGNSSDRMVVLVRQKNHYVFKAVDPKSGFTQMWSESKTPSDCRTRKNEEAKRKRLQAEWDARHGRA